MPRGTVTIYDTCKFVTLVPRKTAIFSFESLCFIYKAFDFHSEFIEACLFYMLAVLHFTCDSRSFCYLHFAYDISISKRSMKRFNYSLHLIYTAVLIT